MFRRNRPFRRLRGGLFNPNGGLAADARQAFDEANGLYARGEFPAAAQQFARLAELARDFNRPRRVAQLHLRAFDAWLQAKQGDPALAEARAALALAGTRPRRAARVAEAVAAELQAHGFGAQAAALGRDFPGLLPAAQPGQPAGSAASAAPAPHFKFPAACPQCGGRLPRAYGEDELECDYCGTVVRGE
jgi:hypothetical protein